MRPAMKFLSALIGAAVVVSTVFAAPTSDHAHDHDAEPSKGDRWDHSNSHSTEIANQQDQTITPKVMIISMFTPENVWTDRLALTKNVTLPGASPIFPNVTCNPCGEICHVITGEGEINAAVTMTALAFSPLFDLRKTYFLVGGIAGVNPHAGTTGSAFFARYTVQVALAYELDSSEIPANWTSGYWLYGSKAPGQAATEFYGTEVFEVNTNLLSRVLDITSNVTLNDTAAAATSRSKFDYAPANQAPVISQGDGATSDVYYAGTVLGEAFGNITKLFTNGTGNYAHTSQEDSATAQALLRADRAGVADLSRLIIMRTASDFDRAPPGVSAYDAFETDTHGFQIAVENIFVAGNPVVQAIVHGWQSEFANGIAPQADFTYTADEFHSLTFAQGSAMKRRAMKRHFI